MTSSHTARILLAGKDSSIRKMDGLGQATDCCLRRLEWFFSLKLWGDCAKYLCHSEHGLLYPLLASRSCRWVLRACWAGRIWVDTQTQTCHFLGRLLVSFHRKRILT